MSVKVLYIHHIGNTFGGSTNSLYELIRAFPENSVNALVLCPRGKVYEFLQSKNVSLRPIPSIASLSSFSGVRLQGWRYLHVIRALWASRHTHVVKEVIADFEPDIVHLNEFGLFWAARAAREMGCRIVMHTRCVVSEKPRWFRSWSTNRVRRDTDFIIAIDESVRSKIASFPQCRVIYNPISVEDFLGGTERQVREYSKTRMTYLTGLTNAKGIWDLMDAAELLAHRNDIIIQIAGTNTRPPEFFASVFGMLCESCGLADDVESDLKKRIHRSGLEDKVYLLGHVDDPRSLLANRTDVLVFPSHFNGVGRSVFEAGLFGIPSVVCLRDRIEDIVVDGENGMIVAERNPEQLAQALEYLADNPQIRIQMGVQAREKYRLQFDSRRSAREVLSVYHELMNGSNL